MISDYLKDRILRCDTADRTGRKEITAGADQGSVLGSDLWNVIYHGILRIELLIDNFLMVEYADIFAAVMVARNLEGDHGP